MGGLKNPFEVLGLTPEIAGRLDENELFSLVKALHRSLQKLYHPDSNRHRGTKVSAKQAARAVELNLAFEKLNLEKDKESFRHYHKLYAGRLKRGLRREVTSLKSDIKEVMEKKASMAEGFMVYLLRDLPWITDNGAEPGHMLPTPSNVKLGLNDVAINHNIRSASWSLGSNYKEIIFDTLGSMYYRPVGRATPFPVNYIRLLGAIGVDEIDLVSLLDRNRPREGCFKCPALDSRYGINGPPLEVLNTMSVKKFKEHCLPLLRPELTERSYLFSIHRPVFEKKGSIFLEGVVVKISHL